MRELGYSDAAAGRRIAAMRLCADNPHTRERLRDGSLSLSAAAELQWAFDRQRRRVPPVAATATPRAATTPAVAALPTEPPLVLDAVGRQKLVEEAAGKSTRQVKQMLADLDPELAAAADRVRPLGNGRYELKAVIDAECQRGLEQLTSLLSHVDPRMTVGQLVGRLVREALDRHDPSRRRPRTGSRPADAHATPTPAAEPEADRRTASPPKQTARPAVSATSTAQTRPGCDGHAAAAPKSRDAGRAIPAAVKREVWQRDRGRCRYLDPHTRRRCTSRHLLQIDHVLPYALGGGSDPANLRGFSAMPITATATVAPPPSHPHEILKTLLPSSIGGRGPVSTGKEGEPRERRHSLRARCTMTGNDTPAGSDPVRRSQPPKWRSRAKVVGPGVRGNAISVPSSVQWMPSGAICTRAVAPAGASPSIRRMKKIASRAHADSYGSVAKSPSQVVPSSIAAV